MSIKYTLEPPVSVYLLRIVDTDYYKIGISYNARSRAASIQTATPFDIVLLRSVEHQDAAMVEQAIHDALHDCHVRGEWFACAFAHICQVFDTYTANAAIVIRPRVDTEPIPATKKRHWMQQLPENAHRVTPEMVAEARYLVENHGLSQGRVAEKLGISRKTAHDIIRGKGRFNT